MNTTNDKIEGLSTLEHNGSSCIFTYLKLIAVPFFVYLYFVLGYLHIIALPVHKHSLILMGIIFITALVFARHNATFGRCYFKKHLIEFNINLKDYILKNLMSIGKRKKSNASFKLFIENETKNIRNDNYSSVAAGIFPTMGILGTFISIAISMPNFASQTSTALEKEISLLLSGVGTAFYVSIYGILLSLWWIFFEKLGLSKFDKDISVIENKTRAFFWTKEEIEQSYLQENLNHFKEIGNMLGTLSNDKFFVRLGESIERKFELFNKMIRLEEKSVQEASTHVKESMKLIHDSQKKQQDLGKIHGDILKTLQHFSLGLDDMQVRTKENFINLQNGQKDIATSLTSINEDLKTNVLKLSSIFDTLPTSLKTTQEQILTNFSSTLDGSIHRFWDESKLAAKERYEKIEELDLDDLKQNAKDIESQGEQVIQSMETLKSNNVQ